MKKLKQAVRAIGLRIMVAILAYTMTINFAVAVLGDSDTPLLSPRFMREKTRALKHFAWHLLRHPLRPVHPDLDALLDDAARRHNIPTHLLHAVAEVESAKRSHRISPAGAMGIMQLMPDTALDYGAHDPFDSAQNIEGAARFLSYLWRRYQGDVVRVVAAYNAGPGLVPRRGALNRLPQETRDYVRLIARALRRRSAMARR